MTAALEFRAPWLGLLAVAAAAAVAAVLWWRWRHPRQVPWHGAAPIANVDHARSSRVFARLRLRYRMLIGAELTVLSVAGIAAAVLAMRPLSEQVRDRSTLNRDVMLCLDVSGSMKELDESILRQFIDIAAGLPGDRIGLTIWNGAAITVFPLTDDTEYVGATLEFAVDQLNRGARSFVTGTEEGGSSLIGDGLASCLLRFDRLDEERARSIVFATDNALAGDPIVSLHNAAAMARARDVRVYAVAPANYVTPSDAAELEAAVMVTGGAYLTTDDDKVVDHVITRIVEAEATHLDQPPEIVHDDRPTTWAAITLAAVGLLGLITWMLRR
jgi:Ca-activated chloride channel family protein